MSEYDRLALAHANLTRVASTTTHAWLARLALEKASMAAARMKVAA